MPFIREAWSIYWDHKKQIVLVGLLLLMPMAMLNFFIISFYRYYFSFLFLPIGGDFTQAVFSLIFLSMMEIPFICLVFSVLRNEPVTLGRLSKEFFEYAIPMYFLGCLYGLAVSVGIVFLIIPGFFFLIFLALFPQAVIMEGKKWLDGLKRSIEIVKHHFFQVVVVLFLLFGVEMILKGLLMGAAIYVSETYVPAMMINLLLYITVFPFLIIWLSLYYANWVGLDGD